MESDRIWFSSRSVVIGDFHVVGVSVFPTECNAPLFVDADGVESFEVSGEGFEIVACGIGEVLEFGGEMDGGELDFGTGLDFPGGLAGELTFENLSSGFV